MSGSTPREHPRDRKLGLSADFGIAVIPYRPPGQPSGTLVLESLRLGVQANEHVAFLLGLMSANDDQSVAGGTHVFANPFGVASYTTAWPSGWRLTGLFGATLPVGSGGGNDASPDKQRVDKLARAVDGPWFSPNEFVAYPGVQSGYVAHGVSVIATVLVRFWTRVQGDLANPDAFRLQGFGDVTGGYYFTPSIFYFVEAQCTSWMTTPVAVELDARTRYSCLGMTGARFPIELNESLTLRPGLSYEHPLNTPFADSFVDVFRASIGVAF